MASDAGFGNGNAKRPSLHSIRRMPLPFCGSLPQKKKGKAQGYAPHEMISLGNIIQQMNLSFYKQFKVHMRLSIPKLFV
jgi:hypothetical protein